MLKEMDIVGLCNAAEKEVGKAAESQVKNWIKGLMVDIANGGMKSRRLRDEADAVDAKTAEKQSQLDKIKSGDWTAIQIEEIRGDKSDKGGKGGKDD